MISMHDAANRAKSVYALSAILGLAREASHALNINEGCAPW